LPRGCQELPIKRQASDRTHIFLQTWGFLVTARVEIVARSLGGARPEGRSWRARCPLHNGASLILREGREGRLLVTCRGGCARLDVLAELRRRGLLPVQIDRPATPIPTRTNVRDETGSRIAMARRIWQATHDARSSPVSSYLAARAITVDPPASLRWAPALRRPDGTNGPAMIARIDGIDGQLIGIARAWLSGDAAGTGFAVTARMLGRAAGSAVRLAPIQPDRALVAGEGVESTLSLMQLRGLPGWTALSASGCEHWFCHWQSDVC
jgi:putative DNA primase/helicase